MSSGQDALEIVDPEGPWMAMALVDVGQLVGFVVYGILNGSLV